MKRLKALDLCCCAGGASRGLRNAGFDEVVGVDIVFQRNYPFPFIQFDALLVPNNYLRQFDFIWASPSCKGYTELRHAPGAIGAPRLIPQFRARMPRDIPWVIENVEDAAADMIDPVMLCGSMFGLGAQGCQLQRHRLFESNFPIPEMKCAHGDLPVVGVYGGHARRRAASAGGRGTRDIWEGGHRSAASQALGIDWMTLNEMSEAIPPAYAEHIGRAAIEHISAMRLAAE